VEELCEDVGGLGVVWQVVDEHDSGHCDTLGLGY
jgi:hypothetical protein